MRFHDRKRHGPPAIIIISLVDVLMVVLIFLMVSTTFKQQPAIKLTLPESNQAREGAGESKPLIVTVANAEPYLYLETVPVTLEKLQAELAARRERDPQLSLFIRADTGAPFGQVIKVMDAAKLAKIMSVSAYTKGAGRP
jgi:biopolymer transport protein ExbD